MALADEIAVLRGGEIAARGTREEILPGILGGGCEYMRNGR